MRRAGLIEYRLGVRYTVRLKPATVRVYLGCGDSKKLRAMHAAVPVEHRLGFREACLRRFAVSDGDLSSGCVEH